MHRPLSDPIRDALRRSLWDELWRDTHHVASMYRHETYDDLRAAASNNAPYALTYLRDLDRHIDLIVRIVG